MSPHLKGAVEKVYAVTNFEMYVAFTVNDGFLDLDSKAFLQRQETVRSGLIDTQFFLTVHQGMSWPHDMATKEGAA